MSVRAALRRALGDFYQQSWRLVVLNSALSLAVLTILAAAAFALPAVALVLLVGPLAAALMHCAVTLAQTEDLRLAEAVVGLRLHWRRGLGLAAAASTVVVAGAFALDFYAGASAWMWPLAILALYVLVVYGLLQLWLWPLAVWERDRPLREVVREASRGLVRRPASSVALGVALLVVNAAGLAAAVLPLLTLTIAYSFLAAAHFALPPNPMREA